MSGIPQPGIHYPINDQVKKSAANTHGRHAQITQFFGGTEITFDDTFAPSNHIMGAHAVGSVVDADCLDADCLAHDHSNLFVAGSAVMPAAGSVNCTLTIAALSLKPAGKLRREL
ncbi:GMC oxidoreductase [Paraburkholderia lycopersici]|uniref:GMC oxidoreductase n=1 Tax=Paraburkholderia lycopersici TaxID=416944 RepID=A0A1G6WK26_9BURK|nr:GMC oxidoreductase [Paraburkholderia lycopersici]SDD66141.1 GMC oxidoreductase [Paraburkholderia lycopersici]